MKNLTLIVHTDIKQALADALRGLKEIEGFTFTQVEGHGPQGVRGAFLAARDHVVGYVPHVRVDLVLDDADVDKVLAALQASNYGVAGRGIYWVTPVEGQGLL